MNSMSRLLLVAALSLAFVVSAYPDDVLTTLDNLVLKGEVYLYDDFSYIVLMETGGKVVVPIEKVKTVEKEEKEKPRYAKRAKLIESTHAMTEEDSRTVIAQLVEVPEEKKPYGIETEAQTLLCFLDSHEWYGDSYRVAYKHGHRQYAMEYHPEKDVLIRYEKSPLQRACVRILGGSGEGMETLEAAAKGKVPERQSGLLERIFEPKGFRDSR